MGGLLPREIIRHRWPIDDDLKAKALAKCAELLDSDKPTHQAIALKTLTAMELQNQRDEQNIEVNDLKRQLIEQLVRFGILDGSVLNPGAIEPPGTAEDRSGDS